MESLENSCRKKLGISKEIKILDLVSFMRRNEDQDIRVLKMLNYAFTRGKSLSKSHDIESYYKLSIQFVEEKFGKYGKYFFVYCFFRNEYFKLISNKKLTGIIKDKIDFFDELKPNYFFLKRDYRLDFCVGEIDYFFNDECKKIIWREVFLYN